MDSDSDSSPVDLDSDSDSDSESEDSDSDLVDSTTSLLAANQDKCLRYRPTRATLMTCYVKVKAIDRFVTLC